VKCQDQGISCGRSVFIRPHKWRVAQKEVGRKAFPRKWGERLFQESGDDQFYFFPALTRILHL